MVALLALLLPIQLASAVFQPHGVPFKSPVTVATGLSASVVFSNLTTPRGIAIDSNQNVLVVERGLGVTAFTPVTSPSVGWERTIVIQDPGFTQGIQVDDDKLYVTTAGELLRYTYDPVSKTVAASPPLTLVTDLPPDGELTTHTLQLEEKYFGQYASILIGSGPEDNIDLTARDPASGRSQVRRFGLGSSSPIDWLTGELLAYGIRNPAGFAFSRGSLYIVENGASIDNITGLTSTFVNDNPADELNEVRLNSTLGKFYGFPDCTTLWNPKADPIGDPQYVDLERGDQISLNLEADRDDEWCHNPANNEPPVTSFQAHSVPLDIKFYKRPRIPSATSLPASFVGQAFVSFHGSFNRDPPTGYGVVRVPSVTERTQLYSFIVQAQDLTGCPTNCTSIRPVGLAFDRSGRLFVTSDSSGELFVVQKAI